MNGPIIEGGEDHMSRKMQSRILGPCFRSPTLFKEVGVYIHSTSQWQRTEEKLSNNLTTSRQKLHVPSSGLLFATDLASSVRLASVSVGLASV